VIWHLKTEEGLQQETGYSDYPRCKRIHDEFKLKVDRLVQLFRHEGPADESVAAVTGIAGNWLLSHVKGDDFRMAASVKSRGVE